jgi:NAD(P)-dependent dehydrogenase (short-subunit alcohol dehydrogenase family)
MKTIIITGAHGHLGSAVTKQFLNSGYRVIATVSREAVKKDFLSNANLDVQAVDLKLEEAAYAFVEESIKKYGKIDAALLLAGGFAAGRIADTTGTDLHQQLSLNFETAYYITRPLFRHMLEMNSGRIVLIGSRPALQPEQGYHMLAYSLSKSLLFKLAELLNAEAKGRDVCVQVVAPGTIDTQANRQSMPKADPGNWIKPEQLADIFEFLVSEKGSPLRETVVKAYGLG